MVVRARIFVCYVFILSFLSELLLHGVLAVESLRFVSISHETLAQSLSNEVYDTKALNIVNSLSSDTCISISALNHTIQLLERQQKMGKPYRAGFPIFVPGVLASTDSSKTIAHHFIAHSQPEDGSVGNCFDGRTVQFENNLEDVTESSVEFRLGCTPFRDRAVYLIKFRTCLKQEFAKHSSKQLNSYDLTRMLKQLGYHATLLSVELNENNENTTTLLRRNSDILKKIMLNIKKWLKYYINEESHNTNENFDDKISRYAYQIMNKCSASGINWGNEEEQSKSLINLRYSLQCYSPLSGAPGVVDSSGLYPHSLKDILGDSTLTIKSCDVHPVCARLATATLLNFNKVNYKMLSPSIKMIGRNPSFETCTNATESNCRYFAYCWEKAIRRVCAKHSVCCPSEEVHEACKENTRSKLCKNSLCYNPENPQNKKHVHKLRSLRALEKYIADYAP